MKLILLISLALNLLFLCLEVYRHKKQNATKPEGKPHKPSSKEPIYKLMGESKGSPKLLEATIGSIKLSDEVGSGDASNFVPEDRKASEPSEEETWEVYDPLGSDEEEEDRLLEENEDLAHIFGESISVSEESLTARELGLLHRQLREGNSLNVDGMAELREMRSKLEGTAFMELFSTYESEQEARSQHLTKEASSSKQGKKSEAPIDWQDYL